MGKNTRQIELLFQEIDMEDSAAIPGALKAQYISFGWLRSSRRHI